MIATSVLMKEIYPDFSEENKSFLDLWFDFVQFVHLKADPRKGTKTFHDGKLALKILHVLVIDSIKLEKVLYLQLGNFTIAAGAIFFTNDFQ